MNSGILEILKLISLTSSTKMKETIVRSHKDNETLKNVFRLAYNKRIVFGIKKVPTDAERVQYRGFCTLDKALYELEALFASRQLTGNAAADHLAQMMSMLAIEDAEIIRRVIKRDLDIGCSEGTACKVWGDDLIPSQPCMKASSYSDKALANIRYPAYAQLKADGTRCMIVKQDGVVTAWSRNGKQFTGITPILDAIRNHHLDNFVLDGELVYKDAKPVVVSTKPSGNFCGTLSALLGEPEPELSKAKDYKEEDVVDRQTGNGIVSKAMKGTITEKEAQNVHFQVWDWITAEGYWAGKLAEAYHTRLRQAELIIEDMECPNIEMIETFEVNNVEEARAIYQKYIAMDLEGIILKNINGIWEDGRSKDQVKFKQVIDIDMVIIGHYPHKKDPNKLGGFTVESRCGLIRNNVGSGFSDTTHKKVKGKLIEIPFSERKHGDREYLMSIAESLYGSVVEMECNGCLARKNPKPDEAPFKLFLGVFKRLRDDKDANDANTKQEVFGE